MLKKLAIIEFSILTISQKHNEVQHLIAPEKSERLSSAVIELMEVLDEIENEHNNQLNNGGDLLEGNVLHVQKGKEANS